MERDPFNRWRYSQPQQVREPILNETNLGKKNPRRPLAENNQSKGQTESNRRAGRRENNMNETEINELANDRNATIREIKSALKRRSGKTWSVTGGRGTAWGWITIEVPPARRTWGCRLKAGAITDRPEDYEDYDTGEPGHSMSPEDRIELGKLLGKDSHHQGESIPASSDYRREYIDRANGRAPSRIGQPYWD